MNLQTIKSINGQEEYVLLPLTAYRLLKKQIEQVLDNDYVPFKLEEYIQNPIAMARITAGITQEELAEALKVTQAYISKVENQKKVSAKLMAKVNEAIIQINQNYL